MKKLEGKEVSERLSALKDWKQDEDTIVKEYEFPNFRRAVDFVDKVANVVEELNHHPTIIIDYNRVIITLTTRTHGGLTDRDFQEADLIDALLID